MKQNLKFQNGFALITALLLLVGLTLLGVSAMRTSIFDEKAAGNVAFRGQTYDLAEAALRTGEAAVGAISGVIEDSFTGAKVGFIPMRAEGATAESWKADSLWSASNSVAVPVTGIPAAKQPRYVVELLQVNIPLNNRQPPDSEDFVRITARAIDPVTGAAVILQTTNRRLRPN
jgi:type IV pilus assembly protein PilX